jgi:hypothetical protein
MIQAPGVKVVEPISSWLKKSQILRYRLKMKTYLLTQWLELGFTQPNFIAKKMLPRHGDSRTPVGRLVPLMILQ